MKDNRLKDSDHQTILECFNKENYHESERLAEHFLLKKPEDIFCLKILGIIYSKLEKQTRHSRFIKNLF